MILETYIDFLLGPHAFWVANSSDKNVPDAVRCTGLAPFTDQSSIGFFIPVCYADDFIKNIPLNPNITLSVTEIATYQSYQFKGVFQSMRSCTDEDVDLQRHSLNSFGEEVEKIGFSGQGFFGAYFHQPSYMITFRVLHVFAQSPYKGTGNLLHKKEVRDE